MDFDKITPLTRTPVISEKYKETTKTLDKYYSDAFLKDYFKLSKPIVQGSKVQPL